MIGTFVRWGKIVDGKPTLDLEGEVMAVGLDGATFKLLVRQKDDTLKVVDARDMVVLATQEKISDWEKVGEGLHKADVVAQLDSIAGTIREVGLGVELDFGTKPVGEITCDLIRELCSELTAAGEQVTALLASLEQATKELTELRAKPSKAAKPPKPTP